MDIEVSKQDPTAALDGECLRRLLNRPLTNPLLFTIAQRRKTLNHLGGFLLPEIYGQSGRKVVPRDISIPAPYGEFIYSLLVEQGAKFAIESGSGFGVSGMYLAAALQQSGGTLISFELAEYWYIAQGSLSIIGGNSIVLNKSFEDLEDHLSPGSLIDFAFIDDVHDAEHVFRATKNLSPWLAQGALIVYDDLGSNDGIGAAWKEIASKPHVGFSALVNGRIGIIEMRRMPS